MDTTSSLFEGTKGLNSVTFTIGRVQAVATFGFSIGY